MATICLPGTKGRAAGLSLQPPFEDDRVDAEAREGEEELDEEDIVMVDEAHPAIRPGCRKRHTKKYKVAEAR